MKSTTRNPRRTGGVVGRGGGSSKPKSWGLNEAIDDGLRRGETLAMPRVIQGVKPFWAGSTGKINPCSGRGKLAIRTIRRVRARYRPTTQPSPQVFGR